VSRFADDAAATNGDRHWHVAEGKARTRDHLRGQRNLRARAKNFEFRGASAIGKAPQLAANNWLRNFKI